MATVTKDVKYVKPFLKWAGGKGQLLSEIKDHLPRELETGQINTYIEPFIGGGAVFFFLAQYYENIQNFYLYDINQDLVNCYNSLKTDVEGVIKELQKYQKVFLSKNEEDRKAYYLNMRVLYNKDKFSKSYVKAAAELIFLNKTCFNGLYRVNKMGLFNVPFGRYKNPNICNAENLRLVSRLLRKAKILCDNFEASEKYTSPNTFVYLDPPYRPISKTASFTSYSKDSFTEKDQIRLAKFCKRTHEKGGYFLLSNSDPKNEDSSDDFFERHYNHPKFTIDTVEASRAINCKAAGRGKINELLIINY